MVYQHYCKTCGEKLSLNDYNCPNCGDKVLFLPNDDDLTLDVPIHDIGFFNFDIDFKPYINSSRENFSYYLCSCGQLNKDENVHCFFCGKKHKQSKFDKFKGLFLSKEIKPLGLIICEECGSENEPDSNFCEFCGETLNFEEEMEVDDKFINFKSNFKNPIFCFCGEENDIESSFCINCGRPLHKFNYNPSNLKVLCTCSKINNINNTFCEDCGSDLSYENEVLICSCGAKNNINSKFCYSCEKPLNNKRSIKTKIICTCGAIQNYDAEYCMECGKHISKTIRRNKSISNVKDSIKNIKGRFL